MTNAGYTLLTQLRLLMKTPIFTWCETISIVFPWYPLANLCHSYSCMCNKSTGEFIFKQFECIYFLNSHFIVSTTPVILNLMTAFKMDWNFPVYFFLISGKTKLSVCIANIPLYLFHVFKFRSILISQIIMAGRQVS